MKNTTFRNALISLGIITIASTSTLAITQGVAQQVQVAETPIYAHNHIQDEYDMELDYYLEDYKEGYRDGFIDGFKAALEELESMYFDDEFFDDEFGDMYEEDMWDEDVEYLDTAPQGLSPTYLPEGLVFEDAYAFTDEDGIVDEGAFYFNETTDDYLDLNRLNITEQEATELYGEDIMSELADLPTVEIAGTVVYIEEMIEDGENYITAYFSRDDGLYTVDSNLSEAEMNIVLSSLLQP